MYRILAITFTVAALLALSAIAAAAAASADPKAHAVTLSDARFAPDAMRYVRPHASAQLAPCKYVRGLGHRFTEVSAYTWRGRALGAQRWRGIMDYWRARTGYVVYDADTGTFYNLTRERVLVAGWCG